MNTPTAPRIVPIEINQKVWIKGGEVHGHVCGILMENEGIQYRIVYWRADGVRVMEWFYAMELGVERA